MKAREHRSYIYVRYTRSMMIDGERHIKKQLHMDRGIQSRSIYMTLHPIPYMALST